MQKRDDSVIEEGCGVVELKTKTKDQKKAAKRGADNKRLLLVT